MSYKYTVSKMKIVPNLICTAFCLVLLLEAVNSLKTRNKSKPKTTSKPNRNKSETEPIFIRILEIGEREKVVKVPKKGELLVGKDVGENSKLVLQCSAPFPVQWIYSGDGNPEISTNSSMTNHPQKGKRFMANAELDNLHETQTGEYICVKVNIRQNSSPVESVSLFIYVPGNSLFVQKTGNVLVQNEADDYVRIPCSVTHPEIVVTLQKNENGFMKCPSGAGIHFTPKSGFIVKSQEDGTLLGSYICIGSVNGTRLQLVEYSVKRNNRVKISKGKPHKGHGVSPNIFDVFGLVKKNARRNGEEEACSPNPCGPNSVCKSYPGKFLPRCTCLNSFIGRPPNCRPECQLDTDCPNANLACIDQRCVDPCSKQNCGEGAICRNGICSCPPGQTGNPQRKCGRIRSPSQTYFPTLALNLLNTAFSASGESGSSIERGPLQNNPNRFPCDPWPCGPNSECKPVGDNAHCRCSKNYVGRPPNCRPECVRNSDCSDDTACIEYKCRDPCFVKNMQCGYRAQCRTMKHTPFCFCPTGFRGDPLVKCKSDKPSPGQNQNIPGHQQQQRPVFPQSPGAGESSSSSEENSGEGNGPFKPIPIFPPSHNQMTMARPTNKPISYPIPVQQVPASPCINSPCAKNAICSFRNQTVGCRCPSSLSGMGSDPYVECYPSRNPCDVCGPNSHCSVKNGGNPTCSCLPGTIGSPPHCRDNICMRNADCEDSQHCHKGQCDDPCKRGDCMGPDVLCKGMKHHAVCACKVPDRDPLFGCASKSDYSFISNNYQYPHVHANYFSADQYQ